MNWLHYLVEANIYLGVFYVAYCLFLAKETYYQLNRAYLILSCVAAFILPLVQVGLLKPVEVITAQSTYYEAPVQSSPVFTMLATTPQITEQHYTLQDYAWLGYLAGAAVLFLILLVKLFTLYKLTRNKQSIYHGEHKLIYLPGTDVAFSFFNYLFLGTHAVGTATIIRHELVHIRQKHSLDIIFLELIKVISWFNPCIYLLQNSLKSIHEYIADEQTAIHETDALTYSSFLVNNAYGAGGSSITHSFFNYNLLKKRIIMLNQQRSGNLARLKYLVAIPVCAGLLCASTLAFSKTYAWVDIAPAEKPANKPLNNTNTSPIPGINKTGYLALDHHLLKTIKYSAGENEKGGLVVVGYKLDKDRKITDLKIVKSGGGKLDALALNGFSTYKGPVNDDAGKSYKLTLFFVTEKQPLFNNPYRDDPEFAGEIAISNNTFVPKLTSKGYEYEESISTEVDGTIYFASVVIFEKNNEPKWFLKTSKTTDLKLLKEKYGYTFPAKGVAIAGFKVLPTLKDETGTTSKGYKYIESTFLDNRHTICHVTIYEKDGKTKSFLSSPVSTATINLLKDTYGYTFPKGMVPPPPPPPVKQYDAAPKLPSTFKPVKTYVSAKGYKIEEGGFSANGKTYYAAIIHAKSSEKMPWANDKAGKKLTIFKGYGNASGEEMIYYNYGYKFPDVKTSEIKIGPPPPPPIMSVDDGLNALRTYSGKVEYPQQALDHEIQGNVVARFNVSKEHKITDVKLVSGIGYGCDEQVLNMLKSFKGTVNGKYKDYLVNFGFTLFGRTKSYPKVIVDKKISGAPNVALNIGLIGYGK